MNRRKAARWPALAVLAVLVVSQVLTDRVGWIQVLWWLPRILLAGLAVSWLLLVLDMKRVLGGRASLPGELASNRDEQRRTAKWLVVAIVIGVACTWNDWGLPKARDPAAFRFAFWNACWMRRESAPLAVDTILSWNADAILLTDPGSTFAEGGAERLAEAGYSIARPGSFAIVSKAPIAEARPVHDARGQKLARIRLETKFGPLVIDAVDLPSETTLHRSLVVRNFAAAIEDVRGGMPDLMAGDFNITRGSGSLDPLVGDATEAFAEAGEGWGGTYPRDRPLFAIDQAFVRAPWRTVWCRIADPGLTRHRAVLVDLVRDSVRDAVAGDGRP